MSVTDTGRDIVRVVRDDNVAFMGASVAYYAVASIVPIFTLAVVALSVFGATDILIDALQSALPASAQGLLDDALSGARGRAAAGVVSLAFALWSGIKVFRGISIAFNEVYDMNSQRSIIDHIWKSLLVLGLLLGAVVLLSATSVALTFGQFNLPYPTLVGNALALVVLAVVLFPIYYVLPPVTVSVRHALPGTVLAAIGWVLLQFGFFYYTGSAGTYAVYGVLGGVLLFITLVYLGATVLVLGAVVNVVLNVGPTVTRSPVRGMATADSDHRH